jgi:hypothetical protein
MLIYNGKGNSIPMGTLFYGKFKFNIKPQNGEVGFLFFNKDIDTTITHGIQEKYTLIKQQFKVSPVIHSNFRRNSPNILKIPRDV